MALVAIKVPSVGESVTEALLAEWFKKDGETVRKDEALFVLETDKVTLEVMAEATGKLAIQVAAGTTVTIGAVVGIIDTEAAGKGQAAAAEPPRAAPADAAKALKAPAPAPPKAERPAAAATPPEAAPKKEPPAKAGAQEPPATAAPEGAPPSVRRLAAEYGLDLTRIRGTGPAGRITKGDVLLHIESSKTAPATAAPPAEAPAEAPVCPPCEGPAEEITRKPMSPIRRRIAERLLKARQNTAMLTTFNVKASVEALKAIPEINAFIDGQDILYHRYYHIGVAVGSERGLVVPVIRHADRLSFAQIEQAIGGFVAKIKENKLQLADLEGGTFTITNGGVFGSLLSTPILNTPQSGILGMHRVDRRPVALGEEVVIRPMMYVALSYDHRIVDGREAVTFLKHIKECIENPERIMMEI